MLAGSGNQQVQRVRPKGFDDSVLALLAPDNFFVVSQRQEPCCSIHVYELNGEVANLDGKPASTPEEKESVVQAVRTVQADAKRFYDAAVQALNGSKEGYAVPKAVGPTNTASWFIVSKLPETGAFYLYAEFLGTDKSPYRIRIQKENGLLFSITDPEQLGFNAKILNIR